MAGPHTKSNQTKFDRRWRTARANISNVTHKFQSVLLLILICFWKLEIILFKYQNIKLRSQNLSFWGIILFIVFNSNIAIEFYLHSHFFFSFVYAIIVSWHFNRIIKHLKNKLFLHVCNKLLNDVSVFQFFSSMAFSQNITIPSPICNFHWGHFCSQSGGVSSMKNNNVHCTRYCFRFPQFAKITEHAIIKALITNTLFLWCHSVHPNEKVFQRRAFIYKKQMPQL